jgi:hypothetical protein
LWVDGLQRQSDHDLAPRVVLQSASGRSVNGQVRVAAGGQVKVSIPR